MNELEHAPMPSSTAFEGTGIVMSGGAPHVLQALANLDVLRHFHKSDLPVEFFHAFELEEAHCKAFAMRGATCRQLQVPGVYPEYETVLPSVMSSSFQHVLWMDTDITPLVAPEVLFQTEAYQRDGAMFWPDHWSHDCWPYGQSAWPTHVVLHLLQLEYNMSEPRFCHEHETGHFLINKEMHWRPICLANYLATRDFFTRVLHGYKDVFRLAFLKLNASNWFSPVRPGIVGAFMKNGPWPEF
ncbi:3-mannosyltransferase MNN14 [Durusdinium trenchii]|uniref:3-mannosyltransferase MNN14 n=1 Tax=Durusdinium trenchii TaxID=1381693 RepID=A0ABP0IWR1_9DINO